MNPWIPDDLLAWQNRMKLYDRDAAEMIGLPYQTYREYLPTGRRRRDGLPEWLRKVCVYAERFGPLA